MPETPEAGEGCLRRGLVTQDPLWIMGSGL
jgi:hypothetical protein